MTSLMKTFTPMKQQINNQLSSCHLMVNDMVNQIASEHSCGAQDVLVVVHCDFNTPYTMGDVKQRQIAQFCNDVCSVNGKNRCAVVLLNMVPQDHSPLGLEDDHKHIHTAFHECGLVLPESFVLPFKLHPRGAAKSFMKTYVDGRFGVLAGNKGDNDWLSASRLAGPGIELDEVAKLRLRSSLHSLTSTHADKDISTSDRNSTTNTYQQRGADHATLFLKTLLKNMHHEHQASPPILIVDPCMHVGDVSIAAHTLRVKKQMQYGTSLYYLGLARDGITLDFCRARLQEDMVEHWFSRDLILPGLTPDDPVPPIPDDELKKIDGVDAAMKPRGQLQFQAFEVNSNGQVQWKPDIKAKWSDGPVPVECKEEFGLLVTEHTNEWMDLLYKADDAAEVIDDSPAEDATVGAAAETAVYEAFEKLLNDAGDAVLAKCDSAVRGVKVLVSKAGVHGIHNTTSTEVAIPARTALGSHGPGNFVAPESSEKNTLPFTELFATAGDQVLMSQDKDNDSFNVQSFYKIVRDIEKDEGAKNFNLSYHKKPLKRVVKDGRERIELEVETPKVYKWDGIKDATKVTFKNVFGVKGAELSMTMNKYVTLVYKLKWSKIGSSLKPRKPYVVSKVPLKIPPGHVLVLNPPSA